MSVEEVFGEVYKDYPFYRRSGGGMTLSGGEPLMQPVFTRRLLEYCSRRNIHGAVETCGHVEQGTLMDALEFASLVLFDFKHIHPLKHHKFTGVDNRRILDNLRRLDAEGVPLVIRVPVVPQFNANAGDMEAMADFVSGLKHSHRCHLLPYHPLALSKYRRLAMDGRFHLVESPSMEAMITFQGIWAARGMQVQVGG
jgi:pyruvate formate lyase activating enzyme